jgi:hypothetical protein
MNSTPRIGSIGKEIQRENPAFLAHAGRRNLTPRTRRSPEVDDNHAWTEELVLIVDLGQLVGGPGAQPLGLGALNERVVHMLRHP